MLRAHAARRYLTPLPNAIIVPLAPRARTALSRAPISVQWEAPLTKKAVKTTKPALAGSSARGDHKVRVAIIGVGNCASSFVQGVHYYRDTADDATVPGLMHVNLGGYHISDIEFSAAIDID